MFQKSVNDVFKCNLKELTTKSANSTRGQRSVWKRVRNSVAFRSCGIGPAVRGVLSASVAKSKSSFSSLI